MSNKSPWNILIVEHQVQRIHLFEQTLQDFIFDDKPLRLTFLPSAQAARKTLEKLEIFSVVILGFNSGNRAQLLELIATIRREFKNQSLRILLIAENLELLPDETFFFDYDVSDGRIWEQITTTTIKLSLINVLKDFQLQNKIRLQKEIELNLELCQNEGVEIVPEKINKELENKLDKKNKELDEANQEIQILTEQCQQLQFALDESERMWFNTIETTPIMVWLSGADTLCYYFNRCWLEFTGRTLAEEMGNGWAEGVHADDFQHCLNCYLSAFAARKNFQMEYRLRHHDGEYRWILDMGVPRFNSQGDFSGYIGFCLDISDRKKAEIEIRETHKFLQTILDYLPIAVFVKDGREEHFSQHLLWNKTSEKLFGITAEEAIGKTVHDFFPQEQADFFLEKDRQAFLQGTVEDIPAEPIDSKTLGRRILHTVKLPLYDENRKPRYLLCFSEDITDKTEAEVALKKAKDDIEIRVHERTLELAEKNQTLQEEIKKRERVEKVMRNIVQGLKSSNSQAFFESLVHYLAKALETEYSVVSQIVLPHKKSAKTVAFYCKGKITHNFEYGLAGTPCEYIYQQRKCLSSIQVQEDFPDDKWLQDMGINSYMGVPLLNSNGEVIGILCVLDSKPFSELEFMGDILQIFAGRVGAELERRGTEQKLKESQEKFLQIAENIKEIFYIHEAKPNPKFIYISPAFEVIWNLPCEAIYQDPYIWLGLVHPDDRNFVADTFASTVTEGTFNCEYRIIRHDGQVRWIWARSFPVKDQDGNIYRVAGIAEDITQRKQAEEAIKTLNQHLESLVEERTAKLQLEIEQHRLTEQALKNSEQRWHLAIEGSDDGIFDWDIETNEVFFSQKWKEILGFQDTEIGNCVEEWISRIHPDDLALVSEQLWIHLEKEIPLYKSEHRLRCRDGSYKWILARGKAIFDEQGNPIRMVCSHSDISDRKQTEVALRESEARFQSFMNYIPAAAWIINVNGNLCYVNPTFVKTLKLDVQDMVGKSLFEIFARDLAQVYFENNLQVFNRGEVLETVEKACRKDGSEGQFLVYKFPIEHDTEKSLIGGIAIDITERLKSEEELHQSHELLKIISEVQSQFIADIDHHQLFEQLLEKIILLTDSEYGFMGQVLYTEENEPYLENAYMKRRGHPYLKINAITNIAWDEKTQRLYEENAVNGMEFHNLKNLFGAVIVTGEPVISNNPSTDPRRDGLPEGHPVINTFLGIPFYSDKELVGMVGLANKPGGYEQSLIDYLQPFLSTCSNIIKAYRNDQLRLRAETQLRQTQERLEFILNNSGVVLYTCRPWGDFGATFVSDGVQVLTGYSPDNFTQNSSFWLNNIHPDDVYLVLANVANLLETGVHTYEYRFRRSDGNYIWVQDRLQVVKDSQGNPIECVGYWFDITERKHLEEEIRNSELKLRSINSQSPGMIFQFGVNPQNQYFLNFASDATRTIYELTPEEVTEDVGRIFSLINPEQIEPFVQAIEFSRRHLTDFSFEYEITTSSGQKKWIRTTSVPQKQPDGTVIWNGVSLDITLDKQREQELKQAKELADIANRAKSEFLANMSHEIRTPMNAILGFCDLLKKTIVDSRSQFYLSAIAGAGKTLLTLINDILDLSKIESGKLIIRYEPVNIRALMQEIVQIFSEKANEKKLELLLEIDQAIPEFILFDEVRLRQIIFNVVGNALKFTEEGYIRIQVTSELVASNSNNHRIDLQISVEDTGIGIEEQQQKIIFEAFMQSEGQSTGKYGGTGLGLAITKRLTELLGGRICLQSEVGKGSIFTLIFPGVVIDNMTITPEVTDFLDGDFEQFPPLTILVADDVQSNRELIQSYFDGSKHHILLACDGLEAIQQARDNQPDLILLDLRMPNMDGIEAAQYLKENETTRNIPIIIVTASIHHEETVLKELSQGFLYKPVTPSELVYEMKKIFIYEEYLKSEKCSNTSEESFIFEPINTNLDRAKLSDLLNILREQIPNWQHLCHTMIRRNLKNFAHNLQELSKQYQYAPLEKYADILATQIQEFELDNLPKTMENFSQVIQDLEHFLDCHHT